MLEQEILKQLFQEVLSAQRDLLAKIQEQDDRLFKIEGMLRQAAVPRVGASENEFYRDSMKWHIRFNGNLIAARKNEKGFECIHKLLKSPGQKFYPNELIGISRERETLLVEKGVEIETPETHLNNMSVDEIKNEIAKLIKQMPDEHDELETRILYCADIVYYAEMLQSINKTTKTINMYKQYKDMLEDYIWELKDSNPNLEHVEIVIKRSRQIMKRDKGAGERSRGTLREQVTKNIKNAIKNMANNEIKDHLNKYINIKNLSYDPDRSGLIDWKLDPDE